MSEYASDPRERLRYQHVPGLARKGRLQPWSRRVLDLDWQRAIGGILWPFMDFPGNIE